MAYERTCIVDNTKYEYCSKCGRFNSSETWRYLFCGENCKEIWNVMDKFMAKKIEGREAYNMLNECDLSTISKATGSVSNTLKEIMNFKPSERLRENENTEPEVTLNKTEEMKSEEYKPRMKKKYRK